MLTNAKRVSVQGLSALSSARVELQLDHEGHMVISWERKAEAQEGCDAAEGSDV